MYVLVILAMIAGFLALRLYSVLGKRTGHEQDPALRPAEDRAKVTVLQPGPMSQGGSDSVRLAEGLIAPGAETGVRALIAESERLKLGAAWYDVRTGYETRAKTRMGVEWTFTLGEEEESCAQELVFESYGCCRGELLRSSSLSSLGSAPSDY